MPVTRLRPAALSSTSAANRLRGSPVAASILGRTNRNPLPALFNGDFDGDGDVDGRDFLIWQRGYGASGSGVQKAPGDATGNQVVDGNDLAVWRETYGNELPAVSDQLSVEAVIPAQAGIQVSREPNRSMAPWAVREMVGTLDKVPCCDFGRTEIRFDEPSVEHIDQAFDHWTPPRRFSTDYGDIATRRLARQRLSVPSVNS